MGGDGGSGFGRLVRFAGLALGCIALANCSGGPGRIDPKYGVSASARVVEPGQEVPKGGGVYRIGKPYMIAGREYVPQEDVNYTATGMASWYGDDFHGRYTANGEIFDMQSLTAAHPTLPLPSYVRVTNLANHKSVVVRVNDRGPYVGNRLIDVSVRTAKLLGFYGQGLTRVKVEYVGRAPLEGSDDRKLEATLRENVPGARPPAPVRVASADNSAYFDARPMTRVPSPPDRPYRLGEGAREVRSVAPRTQTTDLAANSRQPSPPAYTRPQRESEPEASSVSAYAPVRYDAPRMGFMSGRGLY